ncbi:MAG: hypothetical protein SGJ02_13170 [bacterium]|nr:hypothetical protein [bacterium]
METCRTQNPSFSTDPDALRAGEVATGLVRTNAEISEAVRISLGSYRSIASGENNVNHLVDN